MSEPMKLWRIDLDGGGLFYWVIAPNALAAIRPVLASDDQNCLEDVEQVTVGEWKEPLTIHDTAKAEDDGKSWSPAEVLERNEPGVVCCSEY